MKISRFIEELRQIERERGDIDVLAWPAPTERFDPDTHELMAEDAEVALVKRMPNGVTIVLVRG
jgi:hypothetical protein